MGQMKPLALFSCATLVPLPFLVAAMAYGSWWVLAAWVVISLLTAAIDALSLNAAPLAPEGAEFPAATWLMVLLGALHGPLIFGAVWAIGVSDRLSTVESVGLIIALGLYLGQVGNSNAHELIHRGNRWLFGLGKLNFVTILFGHHVSAHRLVHHQFVATPDDPNTARLGESFYTYLPRAWLGSFRAGLRVENARASRSGQPPWRHPYGHYLLGAVLVVALVALVFGPRALPGFLAIAAFAQVQLLLSDYVQHYGLTRAKKAGGGYEPVGQAHSWNAPHIYSGALMLNAPRHSDHHAHPARPYPELRMPGPLQAPTLPHGLPAMAAVALIPSLWRRMMDRRAVRWQGAPGAEGPAPNTAQLA